MELLLDVEELLKEVTIGASREIENQKSNEWKEWHKLNKGGGLEIILNVDENNHILFENLHMQPYYVQN